MSRNRVIGLLALTSIPGAVMWLVGIDTREPGLYGAIASTTGLTVSIAVLIVAAAVLREERDAGTLPYIYMRPMSRFSIAVSSLLAGTAAGLTIALGGWLVTLLASLAIDQGVAPALEGVSLFASAAVGYAAVFVPIGYLVPRSLLVGLGYIVVVESILANFIPGMAQMSVWKISMSIYGSFSDLVSEAAREVLSPLTAGAGGGLAKLAGVVAVGLFVLTWALRRRDAI